MEITADQHVTREKILELEAHLQKMPPAECPVRNFWCNGIYAREMTIPAGVVATGAVHKTEHLTVISKGRLKLMTDDGVQEISAPYIGSSKAGIKRVAFALEEVVITTFHATTETDMDKLVAELTESSACELLGGPQNVQSKNNQIEE